MAQLTFPIAAAELRVDVRVNLGAQELLAVRATGGPAPAAVPTTGVIDTGSNVSAVAPRLVQHLALPPQFQTTTQGIAGPVQVWVYRVSLSILDATRPHLPWFVQPDLPIAEAPPGCPVDVLIGMDVLLGCRTVVDGPALSFTLDF